MSRVDGRPAPVRPERAWGRRHEPATPAPARPTILQPVTKATVTDHLARHHGCGPSVLGAYSLAQLLLIHDAEHAHRGLWAGHSHDPRAGEILTADDEIHRAVLRRIAEGKNPPDVDEILTRVETYIEPRRSTGLALSPYDKRCLEIAQAIAERAARRARRRRGSAA